MKKIRIACIALALSISCNTIALEVENLYVAELPVLSQSARDLARGAREGLLQVLVKVSGNAGVETNPVVKSALLRPQQYYDQYSYDKKEPEPDSPKVADSSQILKIHFEPGAIARLLRDAGFPIWGSNRPSSLIWLAVESEAGRILLSDNTDNDLVRLLFVEAKRRGLPILLPLLDLDDEANITAAAVWGGFQSKVDNASSRYGPDAIVSGRIYRGVGGEWLANWFYKTDGQWHNIQSLSIHASDVVGEMIDRLADSLAQRYALDSSRSNVWMRVDAVEQLVDYVQLSSYLANLTPVLEVSTVRVEGDEVLYHLSTEGQVEQLVELIGMDQKLLDLGNTGADSRELQYRWLQ
jgi:hypothetical protein